MTRWARINKSHQLKSNEATPWHEMIADSNTVHDNRESNDVKSVKLPNKRKRLDSILKMSDNNAKITTEGNLEIKKTNETKKRKKQKQSRDSPGDNEKISPESNAKTTTAGQLEVKRADKVKKRKKQTHSKDSLADNEKITSNNNARTATEGQLEVNKANKMKKRIKQKQSKDSQADNKKITSDDADRKSRVRRLESNNPVKSSRKDRKGHFVKKNKNGYIDLEPEVEKRLQQLKKKLWAKGISNEEIRQVIRKERRSEENKRKRELKKRCFNCRQLGHNVSDCPEMSKSTEQATGICFKCGSTEHSSVACHSKSSDYPFAKCFVCGEQGHISRQCPDNPRGLYPNGGCCKVCSSVEHFKKDCPELQSAVEEVLVERITSSTSADADILSVNKNSDDKKSRKKKIVKF